MKTNETTMTLSPRLLGTASTNKTRSALCGALIDSEHRCVVVCNGSALATIPIPGNAPVKYGIISPETWKKAKAENAKLFTLDWGAGTLNGIPLDDPETTGDHYPPYRQVIPTFEPVYRISLKPSLLVMISESFGLKSDRLTLEFDRTEGPIRVIHEDGTAVLMPFKKAGDAGLLVKSANLPSDNSINRSLSARVAELEAALAARSEHSHPAPDAPAPPPSDPAPQPADPAPPANVTPFQKREAAPATQPPTLARNRDKNGIELRFDGKPSDEVREAMKGHGFRWGRMQPGQPGFTRYSEEAWVFAQALTAGQTPSPQPGAGNPEPVAARRRSIFD